MEAILKRKPDQHSCVLHVRPVNDVHLVLTLLGKVPLVAVGVGDAGRHGAV